MRLALISMLMIPLVVGCGAKCGKGTSLVDGECVADDESDADTDAAADADADTVRCVSAAPCPTASGEYSTDEEWSAIAMCSSIPGSITFEDRHFPEVIPENCLTEVGGTVAVISNGALSDLKGLRLLKSAENVIVSDNENLTSVDGLEDLNSLSHLIVRWNADLTNIDGLRGIISHNGVVEIRENASLCQSAVASLIDALTALGWSRWPNPQNADC